MNDIVIRGDQKMSWDEYFDLERKEWAAQAPQTAAGRLQTLFDFVLKCAQPIEKDRYHVRLIPNTLTQFTINVTWRSSSTRCCIQITQAGKTVYNHPDLRFGDVGLLLCHQPLSFGTLNEHFAGQFSIHDQGSNIEFKQH